MEVEVPIDLQAILLHQVAERAKEVLVQYRENLQIPNVQV